MDKSIYIQGIAGTFMGGIAQLAREQGINVTGSDQGIYPPMSTLLDSHKIGYFDSFSQENLMHSRFDRIIVGNVMTRGNEEVEFMLDERLAYTSGPLWLSENIIRSRPVLAVAGTHGKTTTSSMCAHILEYAAYNPGFLIGGKPGNFDHSARLGSDWFVIEADEYDCAFFDKRSKFVHYKPTVAILNNLEFDHGDIFDSLADIERQFHHFVRTIAGKGALIVRAGDQALQRVLKMGVWTPVEYFGLKSDKGCQWQVDYTPNAVFFYREDQALGSLPSKIIAGEYNALNAIAAIASCSRAGIKPEVAIEALKSFIRPKKRMDILIDSEPLTVIEDFAHHPTAIKQTLKNASETYPSKRLVAVIEKGSNSMVAGQHDDALYDAIELADSVYILNKGDANSTKRNQQTFASSDNLLEVLQRETGENDCIVFMSNRSFDNIPSRFSENYSLNYA